MTPRRAARRKPRDDGDGSGEDQGTRRGDDEDGDGTSRVTAHRPRRSGQHEAQGQEGAGVAVRHADEGGARCLGVLDEPYDAGVGAVGGRRRGPEIEGFASVDRAAPDGLTGRALDGQGFAGHARLVEDGEPSHDHTVDGDGVTRPDQQHVALRDSGDRLGDQLGAVIPADLARLAPDHGLQVPTGPGTGDGFQRPSGGQHGGDQGAGEILAHREGADQSQQGHHVDAHLAMAQSLAHPPRRRSGATDRRRDPDGIGRRSGSHCGENPSGDDARTRGCDEAVTDGIRRRRSHRRFVPLAVLDDPVVPCHGPCSQGLSSRPPGTGFGDRPVMGTKDPGARAPASLMISRWLSPIL